MIWIATEAMGGPIRAGCRCGRAPLVSPVLPTPTRPVRPQSFRQRRRHVRMDTRTPDISTRRGNTVIRGGQPRTVSRRRRMRREPNRQDPNRPGRNRTGRRRPIRSLLIRRQLVRRRPNRAAAGAPAPGPNAIARSLSGLLMNAISSSGNCIGTAGICLDRLLKQRSALRKPDFSFDFPPPRGGLRSLSVAADYIATKSRAFSGLLS